MKGGAYVQKSGEKIMTVCRIMVLRIRGILILWLIFVMEYIAGQLELVCNFNLCQ